MSSYAHRERYHDHSHDHGYNEDEEEEKRKFGKFKCGYCKNFWFSAYAWANYGQYCKLCGSLVFGVKLKPLKRKKSGVKKPHKTDLCERCLSGRCCSTEAAYSWQDSTENCYTYPTYSSYMHNIYNSNETSYFDWKRSSNTTLQNEVEDSMKLTLRNDKINSKATVNRDNTYTKAERKKLDSLEQQVSKKKKPPK